MQRATAHQTSSHSTLHDAGVSSCVLKGAQAWRVERESQGGRKPALRASREQEMVRVLGAEAA